MKQEFLKIIEHFSERKAINQKTRVSIFFICFTISLFIWFLIKMSKEYTTEINFPVQYENPPQNTILTNTQDSVISLKLKSRGFDLLNVMLFESKDALRINLTAGNVQEEGNIKYILTENISTQILRQVEFADQFSSISPDTLRFILEPIVTKKIPVIANTNLSLKAGYFYYGESQISPDSISISGPPSLVDSISFIKTESFKRTGLKGNIERNLELEKPVKSQKLSFSHEEVSLKIQVEEFTEGVAEIPITIQNKEAESLKLFPETAKVTYLIALKDYSNFQTQMLTIGINFNPAKKRQKVEVIHQPAFIKITNIEPETVEYIILK